MIYSSIMFFNELDLLDLKIAEESPYVDKIYITESPLTFTGNQKLLNFPVEKYKDNDKIVYLVTPKEIYKDCKVAWDREFLQRNYAQAIIPFNDDDVCFVTDADEIICGDMFPTILHGLKTYQFVAMHMKFCMFYINVEVVGQIWEPPFAARGRMCKQYAFQTMRNRKVGTNKVIDNCGKHLSYLGGEEAIRFKLRSYSHTECAVPERVASIINDFNMVGYNNNRLKIIEVNRFYPRIILDNLDRWEKYIKR